MPPIDLIKAKCGGMQDAIATLLKHLKSNIDRPVGATPFSGHPDSGSAKKAEDSKNVPAVVDDEKCRIERC